MDQPHIRAGPGLGTEPALAPLIFPVLPEHSTNDRHQVGNQVTRLGGVVFGPRVIAGGQFFGAVQMQVQVRFLPRTNTPRG